MVKTDLASVSGTEQDQVRHPGFRNYEIKNHFKNLRKVVTDLEEDLGVDDSDTSNVDYGDN